MVIYKIKLRKFLERVTLYRQYFRLVGAAPSNSVRSMSSEILVEGKELRFTMTAETEISRRTKYRTCIQVGFLPCLSLWTIGLSTETEPGCIEALGGL